MTDKKMTISQGLRLRKKLKGELATWYTHLTRSISYKKDTKLTYTWAEARKEYETVKARLQSVDASIAMANATNTLEPDGGVLLVEAIRSLAELKSEIALFEGLLIVVHPEKEHVETEEVVDYLNTKPGDRYMMKEKVTITISELTTREVETKIAEYKNTFATVNDQLEAANHRVILQRLSPAVW